MEKRIKEGMEYYYCRIGGVDYLFRKEDIERAKERFRAIYQR